MFYLNKPEKIYLYSGIIDFRKQMNGLSQIIESEFAAGSLSRSWFVFISRDKKQVKLIYWRGSGLALWQYRLEKQRFTISFGDRSNNWSISIKDLTRFLNGYNIFEGDSHDLFCIKKFA